MEHYYRILLNPKKDNLKKHLIDCFDIMIEKYPDHYENIISYLNEVYNYKSPFLVEEKDWGVFLLERYNANHLPECFIPEIVKLESHEIAVAADDFLTLQKAPQFQTLVAKQGLRQQMLVYMQASSTTLSDKKTANELMNDLDEEINGIYESMRADQKQFGNYKGFDAVKKARAVTQINIANI